MADGTGAPGGLSAAGQVRDVASPAVVGPNAVIQTAEALAAHGGSALAAAVFAKAGLPELLSSPPDAMVEETVAARLHRAVCEALPPAEAAAVAADGGRRTAEYILAHRIPAPVQWLLKALPPRLAARLLLRAIASHAWTFAGSGRVSVASGNPARITIAPNPLATPDCPWHRAVFARLFGELVSHRAEVHETACTACGAPACRFEIRW